MSPSNDPRVAAFYAQTYDDSVPDWPGEMEFYRALVLDAKQKGQSLLEVACGTGRVAIRLAREGIDTVGLDISPHMLAVAREKSRGLLNMQWVQADMCNFNLGRSFGLVLIPGHAFQNLNTPAEQVACLECIHRQLEPGGRLVVHLDHQDFAWLGDLVRDSAGVFEPAEQFTHAPTGHLVRAARAWSYEPSTQTAVCQTVWEAVGADGQILDTWKKEPVRLHCVFRFEMLHLLARVGYIIDDVYGDFFRHPLEDSSGNMIWLAHKPCQV
jgi:ubiquinone/menaquinone biosynthesis C-methylase UbiE